MGGIGIPESRPGGQFGRSKQMLVFDEPAGSECHLLQPAGSPHRGHHWGDIGVGHMQWDVCGGDGMVIVVVIAR